MFIHSRQPAITLYQKDTREMREDLMFPNPAVVRPECLYLYQIIVTLGGEVLNKNADMSVEGQRDTELEAVPVSDLCS